MHGGYDVSAGLTLIFLCGYAVVAGILSLGCEVNCRDRICKVSKLFWFVCQTPIYDEQERLVYLTEALWRKIEAYFGFAGCNVTVQKAYS